MKQKYELSWSWETRSPLSSRLIKVTFRIMSHSLLLLPRFHFSRQNPSPDYQAVMTECDSAHAGLTADPSIDARWSFQILFQIIPKRICKCVSFKLLIILTKCTASSNNQRGSFFHVDDDDRFYTDCSFIKQRVIISLHSEVNYLPVLPTLTLFGRWYFFWF